MNSWKPFPLLRLLFPFVAGIILEISAGSAWKQFPFVVIAVVLLLLLTRILSLRLKDYRLRWVPGFLINVMLVLAGYEIAAVQRPQADPAWLGNHPDGLFLASVHEPPALNGRNCKALLKLRYRQGSGRWVQSSGLAMASLRLPSSRPQLQYGDMILIKGGFTAVTDNSNPHGFSYSEYLQNRGITHRVFAASYGWKVIHVDPSGFIRRAAFSLRDRLLKILRENHVEGREFAVASALLLGYVDELDAGLRKDYAATGAMHILSVSGMHVGIIYVFLEFLLGFLNRSRAGRFVKAVILIIFIWFYALLTGLSPCVLRSAAMLSLPIIGKSLNRTPEMFNIIAASVLLILAMDPLLVLDIGFQLSYMAVIGIVVLYKPVYDLYVTSAWVPDKVWSLLAVSIAAQLATLPITLFSFHQFPNYFMLTNLFVVPLSSLVIYVGIVTLVIGSVPVVSLFCAKVLVFLVWLLNSIIHFIEELPYSTIKGIFLTGPEMMLLYVIIGAGFLFLTKRRTLFLWCFLLAGLALNISFAAFKAERLKESRFIIYNAPRVSLIGFSSQDRATVFYNSYPPCDWSLQTLSRDIVTADMDAHGVRRQLAFWLGRSHRCRERPDIFQQSFPSGSFLCFGGHKIFILCRKVPHDFRVHVSVEFLVISNNPNIRMAEVATVFRPRNVIIDATNTKFRTNKWLKEADLLRIPCHAVTRNGAFEKEF